MTNWTWLVLGAWYAGLNAFAFGVYAWDKRAAAAGARRVRERTLLGLVWLGGFVGGATAMRLMRHKTRRWLFRLAPPLAGLAHGAGVWMVSRMLK
ncbi:MAG TPA: DUF1294 domain-containing protein [Phycisphaerales bacterium]|nr:DUF1294 domain-containing protein [Phycisphaerales bacterium]